MGILMFAHVHVHVHASIDLLHKHYHFLPCSYLYREQEISEGTSMKLSKCYEVESLRYFMPSIATKRYESKRPQTPLTKKVEMPL